MEGGGFSLLFSHILFRGYARTTLFLKNLVISLLFLSWSDSRGFSESLNSIGFRSKRGISRCGRGCEVSEQRNDGITIGRASERYNFSHMSRGCNQTL